jgi:hypothetical protein
MGGWEFLALLIAIVVIVTPILAVIAFARMARLTGEIDKLRSDLAELRLSARSADQKTAQTYPDAERAHRRGGNLCVFDRLDPHCRRNADRRRYPPARGDPACGNGGIGPVSGESLPV